MSATAARLHHLFQQLDGMHAHRGWHWWPDADPFEACVGAILVQNTNWSNVERALDNLRAANALSPAALAAEDHRLETLIRPSGQFRQKARKLREFLALMESHGSLEALLALPAAELRSQLLNTWGIGEETADVILLYAAHKPAFVIDAYTRRICSRLAIGPAPTASYAAWQQFFVDNLPEDRDLWARYHALLVLHAKHLCTKNRPPCEDCTLFAQCPGSPARTA